MNTRSKDTLYSYLYILPCVSILVFIFLYPLTKIFINSFYRMSGTKDIFIGLENYKFLFFDSLVFKQAVLNNLTLLISIPILTFLSLLFAFIFYQQFGGYKVYQVIVFVPYVLSIVVVGVVFGYVLKLNGILNFVLRKVGLDFLALDWLGSSTIAIYSLMGVIIWRETAFGIILFLARLGSLNESIFEAAKVDGANWFQTLIYITIPQLKSTIGFYAIYNFIILFAWVFNYVFVMTSGGPGYSTRVQEFEIYNYAILKRMPGMAAAGAVVLLLEITIFVYLQFSFRKGLIESGE